MSFGIGRGFAEVQILKKVKLALSLELDQLSKPTFRCCYAHTPFGTE